MTKNERTALQNFMNRMTGVKESRDSAFNRLRELSKKHSMPVWCCAQTNMEQLMATEDKGKAMDLYDQYAKYNGMEDMLRDYGQMLAELKFWK